LLKSAHEALQRRAATISDGALRQSFLVRIAEHAQILAAWQRARESRDDRAPADGAGPP
jgi:hypothetical protein